MRSKEEIILMWVIVGVVLLPLCFLFPPLVLIGIFMYAAINLYKHYSK